MAARSIRVSVPPQHGAWAFVTVPLVMGGVVMGSWSLPATLFSIAWVAAYPVSYFAGRAITARMRRRRWSDLARREAGRALPWSLLALLCALPLAVRRPWLLLVGSAVLLVWLASLVLAQQFGERSLANGLLEVALASIAVPVAAALASVGPVPDGWREATIVTAAFLTGSVLHVKSLIREANDRRYRWASIAFHSVAVVAADLSGHLWLIAAIPALVRAVLLRPGLRPAVLGAIETVIALALFAAAILHW